MICILSLIILMVSMFKKWKMMWFILLIMDKFWQDNMLMIRWQWKLIWHIRWRERDNSDGQGEKNWKNSWQKEREDLINTPKLYFIYYKEYTLGFIHITYTPQNFILYIPIISLSYYYWLSIFQILTLWCKHI